MLQSYLRLANYIHGLWFRRNFTQKLLTTMTLQENNQLIIINDIVVCLKNNFSCIQMLILDSARSVIVKISNDIIRHKLNHNWSIAQ